MRSRLLTGACAIVAAAVAAPAHAEMIAGWDFSQWFTAGVLSTDGASLQNTLPANYSNLDPTFGAGAESAGFGTMYMDGEFGSTDVTPTPGMGTEEMIPSAGSLASNLDAGVPGSQPFDSFTVLQAEGQDFQNLLGMIANDALSVVFKADLSSSSFTGSDWSVSFGGQTIGGTSTVGVEFSTDGVSYTSYGSVVLNTADSLYSVNLDTGEATMGFVRLNFSPEDVNSKPIIDNLAVNATLVPEPGMLTLGLTGVLGLWAFTRRRRD
jgi:hypothetical protein